MIIAHLEIRVVSELEAGKIFPQTCKRVFKVFWVRFLQVIQGFPVAMLIDVDHQTTCIKCRKIIFAAQIPAKSFQ
ncbi:hypothetical protein BBB43_06325 [Bordetella parapertussis]|nr:hypothetical protein BBB43_06325 [Bordetella parapertussis]